MNTRSCAMMALYVTSRSGHGSASRQSFYYPQSECLGRGFSCAIEDAQLIRLSLHIHPDRSVAKTIDADRTLPVCAKQPVARDLKIDGYSYASHRLDEEFLDEGPLSGSIFKRGVLRT
jgi:hypothetical protein